LLAECYLFGKGLTKNETKAVALLHDAVAASDPRAMDQLATCYHKGIGVGRDDREAIRLYRAAAKLNYLNSAGNLGVLYLTSDETDLGKDEAARTQRALGLFRDGAKQNNAFCMYLYAVFRGGTRGRTQLVPATEAIGIGARRRQAIGRPRIGAVSTTLVSTQSSAVAGAVTPASTRRRDSPFQPRSAPLAKRTPK
jgi:TPR repeat protein